jgi:hypothetical protein
VSVPNARGFLLLRRAGGVWGIASAAVEGLASRGEGYRISVGEKTLAADEILGVVEELRVRAAAPVLRRFWAEAPAGLAVHQRLPVVVVDPLRPPAALRLAVEAGEGEKDGEGWDEERD